MSPPNRERAFDLAQLQADVRAKMTAEGLSMRAVGRAAGIAPSSVTWLLTSGRRPDADSLARILAWLYGDDSPLQRYTLGHVRIIGRPQ